MQTNVVKYSNSIAKDRVTYGQLFIHAKYDLECQSPIVWTRHYMLYRMHFHMLMFRNMQCTYGLMCTSHVRIKK